MRSNRRRRKKPMSSCYCEGLQRLGSGMRQQGGEEERANALGSDLSAGPHTAQRRGEANHHQT